VPLSTGQAIAQAMKGVLESIDLSDGVRLLGVTGTNFDEPAQQLSLLDELPGSSAVPPSTARTESQWSKATGTLDEIRSRFGVGAIGPASTMGAGVLQPVRTGAQAWGPDTEPPRGRLPESLQG
jgi:hypothetical protein